MATDTKPNTATLKAAPGVLDSLNVDLSMEHGAIIQYVVHAVQLRDAGIGVDVRKVAREEMWHLEWLAEAIRDRGGEPTLDRADIFTSESLLESMARDVETEGAALDHYKKTLETIGDSDPELTLRIERIMDDERHHRQTFGRLGRKIEQAGEEAFRAVPEIQPADLAVAGPTIPNEYRAILQYLWNRYGCGDCERSEQYFELAVNEMRHLEWAASRTAGMGKPEPPPVPEDVAWVLSTTEAQAHAQEVEARAKAFYADMAPKAQGEDLKGDMQRAEGQHRYQRHEVERMD